MSRRVQSAKLEPKREASYNHTATDYEECATPKSQVLKLIKLPPPEHPSHWNKGEVILSV